MIPVRADDAIRRVLSGLPEQGELCPDPVGAGSAFECVLRQPATVSLTVRVTLRSRAGIPLAASVVTLEPGAGRVSVPSLPLLAMEGYAHLKVDERQAIERRVWSRQAFVTLEEA